MEWLLHVAIRTICLFSQHICNGIPCGTCTTGSFNGTLQVVTFNALVLYFVIYAVHIQ